MKWPHQISDYLLRTISSQKVSGVEAFSLLFDPMFERRYRFNGNLGKQHVICKKYYRLVLVDRNVGPLLCHNTVWFPIKTPKVLERLPHIFG